MALKNGLPYRCFHTSTQTLHVNRLPGDQRTRSHPPKLRRLLRSASRHSTLIYIAWPALERKRGMALKNGVPCLCFHTSTQTLHVSRLPGDQRTCSHTPKPRRFLRSASRHSTLIYIAWPAKKRGGLKERRPISLPSYLDANAACQSTARGSENTLLPSETAQVSPFGQPP